MIQPSYQWFSSFRDERIIWMSCQFYFWAELCEILQRVVPSTWKPFFPRHHVLQRNIEEQSSTSYIDIYIYIYVYIPYIKKQFQEATTTTPLIHGPSKKATTWPNTSQEKWNSLRSDAVESAPMAAPATPARRMRRKTTMEKGHAQQRLKDGGIFIYIYLLYYIIYIYHYMILYDTIYDTICIYLNIIQYQHDVNM